MPKRFRFRETFSDEEINHVLRQIEDHFITREESLTQQTAALADLGESLESSITAGSLTTTEDLAKQLALLLGA